ncbi:glycosyltransferase family 4 protein [Sunxiuqinia elliptica]
MKLLYLYAELMGYQIPILKQLTQNYNAELHVVHWDHKKLTPYIPPVIDKVKYYKRSIFTQSKLKELVDSINPNLVYISGWMDKDYLKIARLLRNKGIPVVAGSDTQWKGNIKQRIASLVFPLTIKKCFSHIWVAGPYQYEYAKRLGFKKREIIFNTLSANTSLFKKGQEYIKSKKADYPKTFLYVGNFRSIKGTDILFEAFKIYRQKYKGTWNLICVGNGELKHLLNNTTGIQVIDFSTQEELVALTQKVGVFILPSRFDQWGLVVHEFATAGIPLILSENVGSSSTFLIENYNGYKYFNNCPNELAKTMYQFSLKDNDELFNMGQKSITLSQRISPEIVAASLMSVINHETIN